MCSEQIALLQAAKNEDIKMELFPLPNKACADSLPVISITEPAAECNSPSARPVGIGRMPALGLDQERSQHGRIGA
jgi:hypothetical protein